MFLSSNFFFIIESNTGVDSYADIDGYARPNIPAKFPELNTSPFSLRISPKRCFGISILPTLNISSFISPAIFPVPKVTSTPRCNYLYEVDFLLSNALCFLQESKLHRIDVTHKLPLPGFLEFLC